MNHPQQETVAQLLKQMRDQLQDLREDNVDLRDELRELRAENRALRERRRAEPTGRPRREVSPREDAYEPPTIAPERGGLSGTTRTMIGGGQVPSTRQARPHVDDQSYAHRPFNTTKSDLYGRGLEPEELRGRQLSAPSAQSAAPAVDLGYVNSVSADELDALPYGLVVLDARGDVLFYNETESRLAGYDVEAVTGKNFFQDVAPCTRVKEFQGRFDEFVQGKLGRVAFFDFVFYFAHGTQKVLIGLSHGRARGHYNVMMMRT